MFWRLLNDVGLWRDDEYLQRKEARTSIHDKREMMPRCVVIVSALHAIHTASAYICTYCTCT